MNDAQRAVLDTPRVRQGLSELAERLQITEAEVRKRAEGSLAEMWSTHDRVPSGVFRRFGRLVTRSYLPHGTGEGLKRLRELDDRHSLLFLFSHRSYVDTILIDRVTRESGIAPIHHLAGANLSFWPLGALIRRTGALFIRRDTKDDPVYRYVLRAYLHHLLEDGRNLGWSIEGGRTRTGKLRPPRFGALRYVTDAVRAIDGPEVYLVPVSVVYDQLGEVERMTNESRGAAKQPEDVTWLAGMAINASEKKGDVWLGFGEPVPLRERIAALNGAGGARSTTVERVAVEVCHGINRVTPATGPAIVTVALLGQERALTLDEVKHYARPVVRYLRDHPHMPARFVGIDPSHSAWVVDVLDELVTTGVVERFDGGEEPVYQVADGQHLVAAFYRNTLVHLLVGRAIGELTLFLVRDHRGDLRRAIWSEALRLRDLLKFEFFFSPRRTFNDELMAEMRLIDPEWEGRRSAEPVVTRNQVGQWFERTRPHIAHLVLRPYFDAYRVVATVLAGLPSDGLVDDKALLDQSLGLGLQWVRQRKLHSAESVTLELFKTAVQLARHRGLLEPGPDLTDRRQVFLEEIESVVDGLEGLAQERR